MITQGRIATALRRRGSPRAGHTCTAGPANPPTEADRQMALAWLARQLTWETRLSRMRAAQTPTVVEPEIEVPERIPVAV